LQNCKYVINFIDDAAFELHPGVTCNTSTRTIKQTVSNRL